MKTNYNACHGLSRQATYFPDEQVLTYGDRTWTYREFQADVTAFARALHAEGVERGDRVCYLGFNSSTFLIQMFAVWWLGAVFVPMNFRLPPREIAPLVQRADPKVVITEPSHLEHAEAVVAAGVRSLFVLVDSDDLVPAPDQIPAPLIRLTQLLTTHEEVSLPELAHVDPDELAILMFTSGTTGIPKGVQLTFGNVWWNSVNVDSLVDTRRGDHNLAVAPMFHIGGLNALTIRSMVRGGHTLVRRNFDPGETLADIESFAVNQTFLVPAMVGALSQHPHFENHDLSSLRALICAGAPMPPSLIDIFKHKQVPVQQAWGLTETAPFATYLPTELTHAKAGSCGIPMPYTEVRIADPATGEVITEPGVSGEMQVRGPNVTPGYYQDAEVTAAAFSDDWFRTGDIGHLDEDGFFFIVDRLKDMIITGGENVYPAELERVLAEMPGVLDVAVVGQADEKWGEAVVAVLTCRDGVEPTVEEVRDFCSQYLARYKLPKKVLVIGEIPRSGSGKLMKREVRDIVEHEACDGR